MTQATTAGTAGSRPARGERRDERPGLRRLARDSLLIAGRYQRVLRGSPGRLIYPLLQPVLTISGLSDITSVSSRRERL